jgi:Sulfate permease family
MMTRRDHELSPIITGEMLQPRSSVGSHESSPNHHYRLRDQSASLDECESVLRDSNDPFPVSPSRVSHYDLASSMRRFRSSMVGDAMSVDPFWADSLPHQPYDNDTDAGGSGPPSLPKSPCSCTSIFLDVAYQVPAVILISLFHFMIGIPFGVSYFPIGWSNEDNNSDDEGIHGPFPLSGKEALGIRMFLFSTIIAQLSLTTMSGFTSPIGLQMVENVPFCHALSRIVIKRQGYGIDSLSTLFVLFGLSSIIVGAVFYALGRFKLGRVVYYFPNHVLVGCIGGIGIFIAKTGVEVAMNAVLNWSNLAAGLNLVAPLLFFETLLRLLHRILVDESGKPLFSLLSPIYFCLITPMFYVILWFFRIDMKHANDIGFFFPSLVNAALRLLQMTFLIRTCSICGLLLTSTSCLGRQLAIPYRP